MRPKSTGAIRVYWLCLPLCLLVVTLFCNVLCHSHDSNLKAKRNYMVRWYAPFFSGGGYASEAHSFLLAIRALKYQNYTIQQHGDSLNDDYIKGLTSSDLAVLQYHAYSGRLNDPDIIICHSEPGAW